MNGKCAVLFCCLASLVAAQYSTNNNPRNRKAVFALGDIFYVDDNNELRNHSAALAYCQKQGGELAKMTDFKLFKLFRANVPVGSYWIDGVDNQNPERFIANTNCTTAGVTFTGFSEANFKAANCLVLVKETTKENSKIEAVSCSNYYNGVICGLPDCNVTPPPPEF